MSRIKQTFINGLLIIDTLSFKDERGELIKPFSQLFFDSKEQKPVFKETWFTISHKNVIRAMHMQVGPKRCDKLVSVLQGSVLDVVIDLRKGSRTFNQTFSITLDSNSHLALYIPEDCAHGYKVLTDNTITMYMATETHDAQNDVGIKWDSIGFDWEVDNPIVSLRDQELPDLKDYISAL